MFFYIVLTPISTTSSLWSTGNTRKYHQIDVYIYQCVWDENESKVLSQLNSLFLFYVNMKAVPISGLKSFSFNHAIYISTLHCSVRFTICGTALNLSVIIYYE